MATIISTKTSGVGGLEVTGDASGILQLASNNGTTAVTVDASQNVGIGTASPTAYGAGYTTLDVNGSTQGTIQCRANGTINSILYGSATEGGIGTISNIPFRFVTNNTERMRIDTSGNLLFNSGYGSVATAYGCRAWVNFNGTGTVAINASGNVTSITDNGTGDYTLNFTTSMPDANYCANGSTGATGGSIYRGPDGTITITTSQFRFRTTNGNGSAYADPNYVYLAVFR